MGAYFFDSSALVKRYIKENGTTWVETVLNDSSNWIYIARISTVEIISALARRSKNGSLSPATINAAIAQFKKDISTDYKIIELSPTLVNSAISIAENYKLRGYDAVQLATALAVYNKLVANGVITKDFSYVLVSADKELNDASTSEGLTIENPNNYP